MAETYSQQETFMNSSRRANVYGGSGNSGNRKRIILIIVGLIILIALVAFAVVATGGQGDQLQSTEIQTQPTIAQEESSPTPENQNPTEEPTKTVTPTTADKDEIERGDLSIEIQNGSGVAGAATKASDFLKGLGYEITSTGNADNFDYTETVIQVKSSMKEYLDQLEEDLSDEYTIKSATADYEGSSDALVIIGSK